MPQLPSPFHRPISGTPAAGRIKRCHVMAKGERVAGKGGVPLVNFFSRKQPRKKKLMKEAHKKHPNSSAHVDGGPPNHFPIWRVGWLVVTRFNPGLPAQLSKGTNSEILHIFPPPKTWKTERCVFFSPTKGQLLRQLWSLPGSKHFDKDSIKLSHGPKNPGSLTFHEILVV